MWVLLRPPRFRGAKQQTVTTIGLDITKSVLHVAITEPLFRPVASSNDGLQLSDCLGALPFSMESQSGSG
jgi:hypothetical protein